MLLWAWRDSVFKEHCKTFVFPPCIFVSVFNAHRKSVKRFFARYSSAPRCRARNTYKTMAIAKYVCIISFSPFWFSHHFFYSITANNLIYDAEEKNGWFAATSATRVIIFAVRISFLLRSQWDVDRQPYSWKRQPRFDCALFSVPLALLCIGRLLVSCCFHCVYYYLLFLFLVQRYKHIWKPPNKKPKKFVFLTFYNK